MINCIFSLSPHMIFHTFTCILHHLLMTNSQCQRPSFSWLDTWRSVDGALHWHCTGHGFKSHSGQFFFKVSISQLQVSCYLSDQTQTGKITMDKSISIQHGSSSWISSTCHSNTATTRPVHQVTKPKQAKTVDKSVSIQHRSSSWISPTCHSNTATTRPSH